MERCRVSWRTRKPAAGPALAHDCLETNAQGHGRRETRRYWISEAIDWLTAHDQWAYLRAIGMVESTRISAGQVTTERRFYITSLGPTRSPSHAPCAATGRSKTRCLGRSM